MSNKTDNDLPKDQVAWNAIFSIAFLALFVWLFWDITNGFTQMRWVSFVGVFDISIISLATFRLVRLLSYDKIFNFVRRWFLTKRDGAWVKPAGGPRRTVAELLECIWCTGLWAALGVSWLYFVASSGKLLVIILAVAAIGSFLQNFSEMVARVGK